MTKHDQEVAKYAEAYEAPEYRMVQALRERVCELLARVPGGSLLDVGCGRGEILDDAERMGFRPVLGAEIVPGLCDGKRVVEQKITDLGLSFRGMETVTCFDVLEHIPPEDTEAALKALAHTAKKRLLLSINHRPTHRPVELHINLRTPGEWYDLISGICGPVKHAEGPNPYGSTFWEVG